MHEGGQGNKRIGSNLGNRRTPTRTHVQSPARLDCPTGPPLHPLPCELIAPPVFAPLHPAYGMHAGPPWLWRLRQGYPQWFTPASGGKLRISHVHPGVSLQPAANDHHRGSLFAAIKSHRHLSLGRPGRRVGKVASLVHRGRDVAPVRSSAQQTDGCCAAWGWKREVDVGIHTAGCRNRRLAREPALYWRPNTRGWGARWNGACWASNRSTLSYSHGI